MVITVLALLGIGLPRALAVDISVGQLVSTQSDARLVRRESHAGAARQTWEELLKAAEGPQQPLIFESRLRRCKVSALPNTSSPEKGLHLANTQRALREVKRIFAEHNVPVILLGGLLLGFRSHCMTADVGMNSDVATFGPWIQAASVASLQEAFNNQGHSLDASLCQAGPLRSGCTLSAVLSRGPAIQIHVLFSAPAPSATSLPGRFLQCDVGVCGSGCGSCDIAYAFRTESSQQQGRFFPCPLPIHSFALVTWMNETFWTPLETDLYLQTEYGSTLPLPGAVPHRGCSNTPLAPYDSYLSTLPVGMEVMHRQRAAETKHAARIASAAVYDRQLWRKTFPSDTSLSEIAPWQLPRPSFVQDRTSPGLSVAAVLPSLSALLFALALWASVRTIWASSTSSTFLQHMWHQSFDGAALSLYVALVLAQTFLQSLAAARGSQALAAAVAVEVAELLRALGAVWAGGGLSRWRSLCFRQPTTLGSVPVWMLTIFPGVGRAVGQWMSFVSLCWLDPATYVLLTQASFLLVEAARRSSRSACAAALVACAFMLKSSKALDTADAALGRGILCVLFQVPLHALAQAMPQKVDVPWELLSASRHAQGLLVLTALLAALSPHEPYSSPASAMAEVFSNQWLLCAIAFVLVTTAIKEDLLSRVAAPVKELGVGGLMVKASTLQWLLLSWGGDAKDLEALCLGLATVLVCMAEQLSDPLPAALKATRSWRDEEVAKTSTTSGQVTRSVPSSSSAATNPKPKARPPRPEMASRPLRKPSIGSSEVSTTAPSTPRGTPLITARSLAGQTSKEVSSDSELSSELASDSE
ncbi:unnamed protein product [Symbiodinium natans]|uniref:Uncharacterized protein n=1 Tax=Symbiodinium natans TaxID=878477 RepID=A0A812PRP4_9DINO|nr:unnamed protein product [Symbiodinium natans]